MWRDNSGVAHVWEDRCPHRGMKLSFGFVRGDHIACLYHGWQYDTAGRCRYVPAHPDLEVPATITVPVFAAAEACGMIWTCAEPEAARPAAPADAGEVIPVRSLYVDNDADALLQAVRANLALAAHRQRTACHRTGRRQSLAHHDGADTLLLGLQSIADESRRTACGARRAGIRLCRRRTGALPRLDGRSAIRPEA